MKETSRKTKVCSKCLKRRNVGQFYARKASPDGLAYVCKRCDDARTKAIPLEKRRAKHKEWRESNREHVRTFALKTMKQLYVKNPEKYREKSRIFRGQNPDYCAEQNALKVSELRDGHIAGILGGKVKDFPPALLEAKRIQLQIKRYLKNGN